MKRYTIIDFLKALDDNKILYSCKDLQICYETESDRLAAAKVLKEMNYLR